MNKASHRDFSKACHAWKAQDAELAVHFKDPSFSLPKVVAEAYLEIHELDNIDEWGVLTAMTQAVRNKDPYLRSHVMMKVKASQPKDPRQMTIGDLLK